MSAFQPKSIYLLSLPLSFSFLRYGVTEEARRRGSNDGVYRQAGHPPGPGANRDKDILSLSWTSGVGEGTHWRIPPPPPVRKGMLFYSWMIECGMLNRKRVWKAKTGYTRSDVTYNFVNMNSTIVSPTGCFCVPKQNDWSATVTSGHERCQLTRSYSVHRFTLKLVVVVVLFTTSWIVYLMFNI